MTNVEKPKVLVELLDEIEGMDETLFAPKGKIDEEERVLGQMTPWMCKCLALSRHYDKLAKMMAIEKDVYSPEQAKEFPEIAEAAYKSEVLKDLTWFAARAAFNAWNESGIGAREGCKLVAFETEPDELEAFMRAFKIPRPKGPRG